MFPPQGFTLRWFEKFLATPEFVESIRISAMLATASTFVAAVLGTSSALALARFRIPGKATISALLLSPILFPTIVLGLALLVFSNRIGICGHLPQPGVRARRADHAVRDPDGHGQPRAVRSGGRGGGAQPRRRRWRTFFRSRSPLIRPGVLAGSVFAFIISFDELVVTLFLTAPGLQTLPIRIYTYVEYSSDPTISAISTVLIATWLVIGLPVYARFLSVRHP